MRCCTSKPKQRKSLPKATETIGRILRKRKAKRR